MTAILLSPTNFLNYGYLTQRINLTHRNRILTWRSQQAKVGGKPAGDYIILALDVCRATNAMGVLVQSFSMGDGGQTYYKPKELLLCQYVNRSAGYSITRGGRWEGSPGVGANAYLELVFVSGGERTG